MAEVCAAFVILGIAAYAVLGSADFGAGFWDLTAGGASRGARLRGMIQRSMAPVWEANHVWLIFVLVIVWTAFPLAFGSIFTTLYIPLFIAAIGIIYMAGRVSAAGIDHRASVGAQENDAGSVAVGDVHVAVRVDRDAGGCLQPDGAVGSFTEHGRHAPVAGDLAQQVVAGIADV